MNMAEKKWRSVSWLAAAGGVLLLASCRAPAPEVGRYQWTVSLTSGRESASPQQYVFDSVTGTTATWDPRQGKWVLWQSSLPVDWDDIQKQREAKEKAQAELQAKREAFCKTLAQKSLEEQVAWADTIAIRGSRRPSYIPVPGANQKLLKSPSNSFPPYNSYNDLPANLTFGAEDVIVRFLGKLDDNTWVQFFLSSAAFDNKTVFPASATIEDDVEAEVKRQKPKQEQKREEEAEKNQLEKFRRIAEEAAQYKERQKQAAAQEAAEEKEGR